MSQNTPWTVEHGPFFHGTYRVMTAPDAQGIPTIIGYFNDAYMAQLIAAAPELLATLRDTKEWIMTGSVDGVGFDERQVLENIDTLIKQIEGSQS